MKAGPALIRALARALVRLFYHRVEIVGADRVARSGPLVVVANHRNALVDPLILMATMPRVLRPVAKSDALPPSDPGAVPAPGRGAPSPPSAGSGQRPDTERGHVPRGGRGAPCRRGDPDLSRGREPARARADAASDGRRADGPGNGRRRGAAGDDALAHRPHVPRARDLPDRMGAGARRRAGAGGGLPRDGGPRAGAGRARAHGPGGRGVARGHRGGRGSRDPASRRRPGGDSTRGGRGRPRSRGTIGRRARSGWRGSRWPRVPIGGSRLARPVGWRASGPRSRATSPISSGSACRRTSWRARIRRGRPAATRCERAWRYSAASRSPPGALRATRSRTG